MRTLLLSIAVFLTVTTLAFAQGRGAPNAASMDPTASDYSRTVFVSGKVVLDDGTELTEPVEIQTICGRQRRTVASTDTHGSFSFRFGDATSGIVSAVSDAGTSSISPSDPNRSNMRTSSSTAIGSGSNPTDWQDCRLQAVLAGFYSEEVELASRLDALQNTDLGRLKLHRLQQVEGTSISATSAAAPSPAKKALEKGLEEEKKRKFDDAQKEFEKAVQIYPKYAVAWFELGRLQAGKNDPMSAKYSFQRALSADPKYVNPYDGLAQLAMASRQWPEVVDATNKLLALNPVNFVDAYFFNGVANYYLHNFDAAEQSARQGLNIDQAHQIPKLAYLLAMALTQKHDFQGASQALEQYVSLIRDPAEVQKAKKELADLTSSVAAATPASANQNK
jgi:tetratricopeptide (TPR) repeat protein